VQLGVRLDKQFVDADSLHSATNVTKIEAGMALEDADRWPWLVSARRLLRREEGVVLACSDFKRQYRDLLRSAGGARFGFLDIDRGSAEHRVSSRTGHLTGAGMVSSQLQALEHPTADERDVVVLDATDEIDSTVDSAVAGLTEIANARAVEPIIAGWRPPLQPCSGMNRCDALRLLGLTALSLPKQAPTARGDRQSNTLRGTTRMLQQDLTSAWWFSLGPSPRRHDRSLTVASVATID
jgi:gluconokinase